MKTTIMVVLVSGLLTPGHIVACEPNPAWQELTFQRKSIWGTVDASLALYPLENGEWRLDVRSSAGKNNEEQVTLTLESPEGNILEKLRYSRGRKARRFKSFDYRGDKIFRTRKDPAEGEELLATDQWSQVNNQTLSYPALPENAILTTPYMLLLLAASPDLVDVGNEVTAYIHTDFNIYHVTLVNTGPQSIVASYTLSDEESTTTVKKQSVQADVIEIRARPYAEPARPDFELMGLTGEVSILIESESRIPLRVRGSAPRVGETHIDLIGASH